MVDLGEDEERLTRFMTPIITTMQNLKQMMMNSSGNSGMTDLAMKTLIGLARDLRGLIFAFNTKSSYAMLFDIIYPNFTEVLNKALEVWSHEPAVTTPVLKMMTEMALNRGQRLNFDVSSPNGILLFKEASKFLKTYGTRLLEMGEPPKEQLYSHRLKGISLSYQLLKNSLSGGYVNFGVFRLYNDACLDEALNVFVKLSTSIESNCLLTYPKLSTAYHSLLEIVTQDHMSFLASLPAQVIHHILATITEGLTALDTMICTCCCTSLDHIVTYLFRTISTTLPNGDSISLKRKHEGELQREQHFLQVMMERRDLLETALSTVLHTIMFEDCRNQWSMSRPLLGLVLINQEYLQSLEKSLCEGNSEHGALNPERLRSCFQHLMNGVDRNLHTKTRDRFTQNMSAFRRDVTEMLKSGQQQAANQVSSSPQETGLDLTVSSSSMMS